MSNKKILVAMSGGVDSSLVAAILQDQGFDVVGVYFVMQKKEKDLSYENAKKNAKLLGIELFKKDISKEFQTKVIEYFIETYKQNCTPNPCVICNPEVKFFELLKFADELKIDFVATGHYARIEKEEIDGKAKFVLKKAKDKKKDQSYFLYRLDQRMLARTIFPLENMHKTEVKNLAKSKGLAIMEKESQDACFFLRGQRLADFLEKSASSMTGNIVDETGSILGRHKGLLFYTKGQRTGLGLSGGPFYILKKNIKSNQLVVTDKRNHPDLENKNIVIHNVSWTIDLPEIGEKYKFRSRYQVEGSVGEFVQEKNGKWKVKLDEPQWAVMEGQSLVAYDGDVVVGGGIIV